MNFERRRAMTSLRGLPYRNGGGVRVGETSVYRVGCVVCCLYHTWIREQCCVTDVAGAGRRALNLMVGLRLSKCVRLYHVLLGLSWHLTWWHAIDNQSISSVKLPAVMPMNLLQ